MRITSNMLVQQLAQAAKNEGAQKLEVGAAITARISEVLNGFITLDTGDGRPVMARDLSGNSFYPGQTVNFEFAGMDENGVMQIRLNGNDPSSESDSKSISLLLNKLNLTDTQVNRDLVRILSAYRIPLNNENIKAAQELNIQAKGIVQLSDKAGTSVLAENESEPLKLIAARLIEITGTNGKGTAMEGSPAVNKPVGQVAASPVNHAVPTEPNKNIMPIASSHDSEDMINSEASVLGNSDLEAENPDSASSRGDEIKNLLKQLTFEKIGFIIKNQLPNDLGTLDTMEKLILGKKELGIQLRELLVNLKDDTASTPLREVIQNILKAVHIHQTMDAFEFQKQLKSLNQELAVLSAKTEDAATGNQKVMDSLTEVKNSLDFLGRLSESATYLHVPVNLGQGTKPMDLFIQRDKSGKKKVNPKDTRIFISLATNHMETVQCMVEVQEKKLNIGFKLSDADGLDLIGKYFEPLKISLSQLGYSEVMIHGTVYKKPLNLMDITQETSSDLRRIDMKV